MIIKPLGDAAWLVEFAEDSTREMTLAKVLGLAAALEEDVPENVIEVVTSFASLAVRFSAGEGMELRRWIEEKKFEPCFLTGKEIEVPVCYGGEHGPDLEEISNQTGLTEKEIISAHGAASYTVAAVGFSPGFPYLLGLPESLHVPRQATPRLVVPAGSVAIAAGQVGIYPFASPGGWNVLGRTDFSLFDPSASRPARLRPGDRVKFKAVNEIHSKNNLLDINIETPERCIEVIRPGAFTTVQDLGRPGYESSGVSPGGAADPRALRIANLMVGNNENTAALELCMSGPVLKFHQEAFITLAGATGKIQQVAAGETVDFSKLNGAVRVYLAVAGGIVVPKLLDSASTDVRSGFGGYQGRALKAGDLLEFGQSQQVPRAGDWHIAWAIHGKHSEIELRFITGVQADWFSQEAHHHFRRETYQVSPHSDRMGARLTGQALMLNSPREMRSQPVACGSVQVPPDGQPIVLLSERQTIGGYPQIGHVISVDLPKLARAWPGTTVRFREISREEAIELRHQEERDFQWLRTGLELLK